MQHLEKRLIPRTRLEHFSQSALSVIVAGQSAVIKRLRDISESGLSFYIDQPLTISQSISVEYVTTSAKVEVFGRVAWCSEIEADSDLRVAPPHFLVGVELMSPMLLLALLPKK